MLNFEDNYFYSFNLNRWDKEIQVGLTGYFLMIKIFGKKMALKRYGRIINIASDLSVIAPNHKIYNNKQKLKVLNPSLTL